MTLERKQAGLIGAIIVASVAVSVSSRSFSPLLYSVFPVLAIMWIVSNERNRGDADGWTKKLPWRRKLVYYVVLPLFSILGLFVASSDYHRVVPAAGFWITISIIHGIFLVKLYSLYVKARDRYGI